jgi:hypothetical protein
MSALHSYRPDDAETLFDTSVTVPFIGSGIFLEFKRMLPVSRIGKRASSGTPKEIFMPPSPVMVQMAEDGAAMPCTSAFFGSDRTGNRRRDRRVSALQIQLRLCVFIRQLRTLRGTFGAVHLLCRDSSGAEKLSGSVKGRRCIVHGDLRGIHLDLQRLQCVGMNGKKYIARIDMVTERRNSLP